VRISYLTPHPTRHEFYREGIKFYLRRIRQLWPAFEYSEMGPIRTSNPQQAIAEEERLLTKRLKQGDHVVILDERGELFTTRALARQWEQWLHQRIRRLIFVSGGPYGFSESFREKSHAVIALSPMTLSHEMTRLVLLEQLYRVITLWKGLPYHH